MRGFTRFFLLALCCPPGFVCSAAVEQVSLNSHGQSSGGVTRQFSISADGRYVAFASTARLTPDDRNTLSDVYVRDRVLKTTRRISDDRGGDQPAISANGRSVVFRALDGLTRLRVADLERGGIPVAAAFAFDSSNYDRPSDSGTISPDGRFVGYAFRPSPDLVAPDNQLRGHEVMVTDLPNQSTEKVVPSSGSAQSIPDLGKVVSSFDGELVVFESGAALTVDDTNPGPDLYLTHRSQAGSLLRISKPEAGVADPGSSSSPSIAQDGSRIFFISTAPLAAADPGGRAMLYMVNNVGGTFSTPIPIPTKTIPVALAPQATVSGRSVAFLGRTVSKIPRAVVFDVASNTETVVPLGSLLPDAAPVLTGDGSEIAFSAPIAGTDHLFVATVPGANPQVGPTVTLVAGSTIVNNETVVAEGSTFSLSASATPPPGGTVRLLKIEQNGLEIARVTLASVARNQTTTRGIYDLRARGFADEWIEGVAPTLRLVVKPKANLLAITGVEGLTQTPNGTNGSVSFTGNLRIDNTRSTASGPLRVILTDAPTAAIMAFGAAEFSEVPPTEENVLAVLDVPSVAGLSNMLVPIGSFTSPTDTLGDGFEGRARTVFAYLREKVGVTWTDPENPTRPATVLQTLPKLDENTNLPNGGVPITDAPGNNPAFNPQTLLMVNVQGPTRVGGPSQSARFAARAVFNTGDRACTPQWSLLNAGATASISPIGLLTVHSLTAARNIMVTATFAGVPAAMPIPVTIFPLPPAVFVRAHLPTATEAGVSGDFRISRSGNTTNQLTVAYTMEGTAENGADYQTLSGTATILAGSGFVDLPVVPIQDSELEGTETVTLRLAADPAYRILGAPTARVSLLDDEPIPPDQPDLTLQLGARPIVGARIYQTDDDDDDAPMKQLVAANGARNLRTSVVVRVANRGTSPQTFHLQASPASIGFTIRYLHGPVDVTQAVVDGTFTFPELAPGQAAAVTVGIVPTADAPVGGVFQCDLRAFSDGGSSDFAGITVKRVR
jgi:hypothetical protein